MSHLHLKRSGAFKLPCLDSQNWKSSKERLCDVPGWWTKKKIHDGESFANCWSHPKTGRRLFAGEMFVLEDLGWKVGGILHRRCWVLGNLIRMMYVLTWREVVVVASQRTSKIIDQVYISIESPLALAKLNPAPPCGPLAPKPKVPCPPSACGAISSPASSSSEKYFSIMLYAFI